MEILKSDKNRICSIFLTNYLPILCLGLKLPIFQIPWCESVFGSFRSPSPIINITMKMIIMEGQQWNVKHVRKDGEKKDYIPTLLGHLIKYMFL